MASRERGVVGVAWTMRFIWKARGAWRAAPGEEVPAVAGAADASGLDGAVGLAGLGEPDGGQVEGGGVIRACWIASEVGGGRVGAGWATDPPGLASPGLPTPPTPPGLSGLARLLWLPGP